MRSKSQHIHQLIVNSDLEGGPVRPAVSLDGNFALLGPFRVDLVSLGQALEILFDAVCSLFPGLDPLNIPTTVSNGSR